MARIPKPIIRTCLFCGERFDDSCMLDHRKEPKDGKQYCKPTAQLLSDGWSQTQTGAWHR